MRKSAKYFTGIDVDPPATIDEYLKNEIEIVKGSVFKVISTPGHSPGSVCLYSKKENIIFVGDLIFEGGYVGRTDFKYADDNKLHESINKILKLPKDTIVYPGHGNQTTIDAFSKTFDIA